MFVDRCRKSAPLVAVLIMISLILSACGQTPPQVGETPPAADQPTAEPAAVEPTKADPEAASSQREVVVAFAGPVTYVDPHMSADTMAVQAANCMFDPLVTRAASDMSIVPALAESWDILDPLTYVFHLRQGVRFHNGEELTSSDVKFTFERMVNFPQMAKHIKNVESVEALDDYTVQIRLLTPYAPWLVRMPTFYIVPEDYVKEVGDEEFARSPIGTGPYRFVEWVHDDYLKLEANEDYWGGAPEVKRTTFKVIPEASTRVAALLVGEVDAIEVVPPEEVPRLEADENVRVLPADDFRFYFFAMNQKPPFDDVRVRQAVSYAIDWDTILQLFGGYAHRTPLPALPGDFGYAEYADELMQYTYAYDPDKARQLLAEAGYPDGFETVIEGPNSTYPNGVEVCQAVAAQLTEVGIKAEVKVYEYLVYFNETYQAQKLQGIGIYNMGNPIFDPDHLMGIHFDPDRSTQLYFQMPELTELIHKGTVTVDKTERVEIYREAMKLILEQAPFVWGYGVQQIYAVRSDIEWTPRTDVKIYPQEMSLIDE